jgi:predicted DNA-binding antitoxin AbrB/MazE fold protein
MNGVLRPLQRIDSKERTRMKIPLRELIFQDTINQYLKELMKQSKEVGMEMLEFSVNLRH